MYHRPVIAAGFFAVWFSLSIAGTAPGQDPPAEADPELGALDVKISNFLETVRTGEAQKAYEELLAGSQLAKQMAKQDQAIQELIDKTNGLTDRYGQFCGYERISAKRIGEDLVLLRYLYKCEDFPVVWYFTFYRASVPDETPAPPAEWRVITVRFDTKLELLGL